MKRYIIAGTIILCMCLDFYIHIKLFVVPKEEYIIENINTTKDKTAIFFGDSIVSGWLTNGYSYVNYIKDNYDLKQVINAGIAGYRVSTYKNKKNWILNEIETYKEESYDYVILEGGINDMLLSTPLGNVNTSFDSTNFDITTFAGGLEWYIYTIKKTYPTAKIGYVITYNIPKYSEKGKFWTRDDYKLYVFMTKTILTKWKIPYIDLSTPEFDNLLEVEKKKYLPDYLHPNKEGYEIIYPYIYNWMKTL